MSEFKPPLDDTTPADHLLCTWPDLCAHIRLTKSSINMCMEELDRVAGVLEAITNRLDKQWEEIGRVSG